LGTGAPSARDAIVIGLTGNSMFKKLHRITEVGNTGQFNGTISTSPIHVIKSEIVVKSQLDASDSKMLLS
jgi:hypothetical protein